MSPLLVTLLIIGLIIVLLIVGSPMRLTRLMMQSFVRLGIGVLILFFINVFGGMFGLHIPINIFTVLVTGFLGVLGAVSIAAIHLFIL